MFNSVLNLSDLDGSNGFEINGINSGDRSGFSVSTAGDVNNDGFDDVIIGAPSTIPNGTTGAGASYVVFGGINVDNLGTFDLSSLDGSNGFIIDQIDPDDSNEISVNNAGDVNNDGIEDFIIGASTADPDGKNTAGESYVIFGDTNVGSLGSFDLSILDGSNGFILNGIDNNDRSGRSVGNAGDINNDGIGDLIIGAPAADPNGNSNAGESYVVFGGTNVGSTGSLELSALDGSNGFVINGIDPVDFEGFTTSNVGDINNDGVDDLIIGAGNADPNGNNSGESYVVFGDTNVGSTGTIDLSALNGSNGFILNGIGIGDLSGRSVSNAGDINGDGIADLIIGAPNGDTNGNNAGESYVVFGGTNIGSSGSFELSTLDGSNGFIINGIGAADFSGRSVSNAGDIDDDGIDDIIIGATRSETSSSTTGAGDSYVIFGSTTIGSSGTLELSDLDGSNGFLINGVDLTNSTGYSVSNAGDVNNDGAADVIIGAFDAEANGNSAAGQSYVVYGIPSVSSEPTNGDDDLTGLATPGDDTVNGLAGNDTLAGGNGDDSLIGAAGNDLISGDNDNDTLIGSIGDDTLNGGAGDDVLDGRSGNDLFDGGSGADQIFAGSGDDTLNGGSENDLLLGGIGLDSLNGDDGDDTVNGLNGDDTLNGGNGNDSLLGGTDSGADLLNGNDGNDTLNGFGGNDTLNGGADDDRLNGGDDLDEINGDNGNDFVNGGAGDDTVNGGIGDDTVNGGSDSGADLLNGNEGNDQLSGASGDDTLNGGSGIDTLFGGSDNDILNGGSEDDRLFGISGLDELNGDEGNDLLNSGDGNDTINGGNGNDTLLGMTGADILNGNADNDRIFGAGGDDTMFGDTGDDLLSGQNDDDYLSGGLGRDTLFGGAGADQFAIASGTNDDLDIIQDFEDGVDLLDLTGDLTFGSLNFAPNANGNSTRIIETDTNQILAVLTNVTVGDIDASDFI